MNPVTWSAGLAFVVWLGTLVGLEIGFHRGRSESEHNAGRAHEGIGAVEASSFALLGLLLGFSFAGATSRLEAKRQLVVAEANAMSTAYSRVDLLPAERQPAIRQQYRDMLDARLHAYNDRRGHELEEADLNAMASAQQAIWSLTVAAVASSGPAAANLVLPSINEMIDIGVSRTVTFQTHVPGLIVGLLVGTALLCALLAGFAMAKRQSRSVFHALVYASLLAITVYAVLDLDYPRFGLINIDAAYRPLTELRASMK